MYTCCVLIQCVVINVICHDLLLSCVVDDESMYGMLWNYVVIIICGLNVACLMMCMHMHSGGVNSHCVEFDLYSQYPYPVD